MRELRVRLIDWNAPDAEAGAERRRGSGYHVVAGAIDAQTLRVLREAPPAAVVIGVSSGSP